MRSSFGLSIRFTYCRVWWHGNVCHRLIRIRNNTSWQCAGQARGPAGKPRHLSEFARLLRLAHVFFVVLHLLRLLRRRPPLPHSPLLTPHLLLSILSSRALQVSRTVSSLYPLPDFFMPFFSCSLSFETSQQFKFCKESGW